MKLKVNHIGDSSAPLRKVAEVKGDGWKAVTLDKAVMGWSFLYSCKLECGHEMPYLTKPSQNRGGDPPAPSHMHCSQCMKERESPTEI